MCEVDDFELSDVEESEDREDDEWSSADDADSWFEDDGGWL